MEAGIGGMKTALILGITGQDGSYLAELLLAKGYAVHGVIRRSSSFNTGRIEHIFDKITLHHGDLSDGSGLRRILKTVAPDEVYNLAAQSHVRVSFDQAEYTADVTGMGTLRLLEALRDHGQAVRLYQAGSSEMFGAAPPPQSESTPFYPRSPYAVAKVAAYWNCVNYREAYGMFVSNGILFNHESPRRGETFVTRKITRALTRIKCGLQDRLVLGNLDASRDWGFAGDYVRAMWLMLQQDQPGDYVVATGESYTVRDFLDAAGAFAGVEWERYVTQDERYFRPTEVDALCGDASKAAREMGWRPETDFPALVADMVQSDMLLARKEAALLEFA